MFRVNLTHLSQAGGKGGGGVLPPLATRLQGQGQQEGNRTWLELWNLLTINLREKFFHNSKD